MLLTAIELQGGQANIEGMSYRPSLVGPLPSRTVRQHSENHILKSNFYFSDLVTAMTTKKG